MTQRNYGRGRPTAGPAPAFLHGADRRVPRSQALARSGASIHHFGGLLRGWRKVKGKQDAPERRVAAQGDGRIQPLGFGLRPRTHRLGRTVAPRLQLPPHCLRRHFFCALLGPFPVAVSLPPSSRPLLCLTNWFFLFFTPSLEHWTLFLLHFSTPPPRSMESTPIHQPLRTSLLSRAPDVQYRLPPGKQLCSPLYHQRGYPLNVSQNISLGLTLTILNIQY